LGSARTSDPDALVISLEYFHGRTVQHAGTRLLPAVPPVLERRQITNRNKEDKMNKGILTIACALIAPMAFAQTSTTTTERTATTSEPVTTTETTYSSGTVTTYEPGKTIVVKSPEGPVSFALGTAANVVDAAGKIVTAPLRAGQKVRVYYTGPSEKRVVQRVIVED
jgi:hypothetical protein